MSIPHSFDPMGVSGGEWYVTDGLIFMLDCRAAGDGDSVTLTNLVSGHVVATGIKIVDNVIVAPLPLTVTIDEAGIQRSVDYTQEIVCAKPKTARNLVGFAAVVHDETYNWNYPVAGEGSGEDILWGRTNNALGYKHVLPEGDARKLKTLYFDIKNNKMALNGVITPRTGTHSGAAIGTDIVLRVTQAVAAVRVYNRSLTADEIAQNARVDAARYNMTKYYT